MAIITGGSFTRPTSVGRENFHRMRVVISRVQGARVTAYLTIPPRAEKLPSRASVRVVTGPREVPTLVVSAGRWGLESVTLPTNHPQGLRVQKLPPVLRHASPDIEGFDVRRKPASGKLILSGVVVDVSESETDYIYLRFGPKYFEIHEFPPQPIGPLRLGRMLFSLDHSPFVGLPHRRFEMISPDELRQFTGDMTREISPDGSFRVASRVYYLPRKYAGSSVVVHFTDGKLDDLVRVTVPESRRKLIEHTPIPLSELIQTRFFNLETRKWEVWQVGKISLKRLKGKHGYLKIGDPERTSLSFGARHHYHLETGYGSRYVEVENGQVLAIHYFRKENARPTGKPDKSVHFRQLYSPNGRRVKTFLTPDPTVFSLLRRPGSYMTHIRTDRREGFHWQGVWRYLQGWQQLWIIAVAERRGLRLRGYSKPEIHPTRSPREEVFFPWDSLVTARRA